MTGMITHKTSTVIAISNNLFLMRDRPMIYKNERHNLADTSPLRETYSKRESTTALGLPTQFSYK